MNKGIGSLLALQRVTVPLAALQLGVALALPAQGSVAKLFPPAPSGFVTDVAHLLDDGQRQALEARLQHLQELTGADIAVVTLPTIGDAASSDVALAIGRAWKVGGKGPIGDRRRNAGLVMLVVPHTNDHGGAIAIQVAQGSEGAITDSKAGEIRDAMMPALQQRAYGSALDVGTSMAADIIARDLGVQDSSLLRAGRRSPQASIRPGLIIKFIVYGFIFLIWIISVIARNRGGRGGGGGGIGTSWILPYMIGRSFGGGGGFGGGGFGGGGGGGGGFGGFGGGGGFSGGGASGSF